MKNNIFLEVNGIKYEGFTDLSYSKNIEDLSGIFSFSASTEKKVYTPFKGQEICKILVNDIPLITGYIENINYSYDESSHIINIQGRDKTCDIIDNSILGNVDFKSPITLEDLIKETLKLAQLLYDPKETNKDNLIKVINKVTDLTPFEKKELSNENEILGFSENENSSGQVGENLFEFIEKYARKRSVLLTSNGNGDLVITRAGSEQLNGILLNELNNNNNNIKRASINYDFSDRYFGYICKSQGNASAIGLLDNDEGVGLASLEGTSGTAIDSEIRKTRKMEFMNETSSIDSSNIERATWEANIRRSRSKVYTCELNHLFVDKQNKIFFEPNKLIKVKDDFCDINAIMLIRSVTYNLSSLSGTSVILELVPKDAYSPVASANKNDEKYNKIGESVE